MFLRRVVIAGVLLPCTMIGEVLPFLFKMCANDSFNSYCLLNHLKLFALEITPNNGFSLGNTS